MSSEGQSGLRADIQAMRAIAVAAVFAYHLFPGRVPGGFTGVDVFFVISGFLITGNLVREAESTGRIDVPRFWGRRMRRLLPASLLVLLVTAVATMVLVPVNLWDQFLREIGASALYVQNWLLAANSVDYLAAENAASPVQHFWTLSVEEQFYIATPLLLLGLLLAGRRLRNRRPILLAGLAAVLVFSLALSVHLTEADRASAYFMTITRAWEFCAGAMLVFIPSPRSRRTASIVAWLGLAAVVSAAFLITGDFPFPGAIAAWPVVGAAALIWGGKEAGGAWAWFAERRAVRYVGDVSYAIYLWHWPLIVLIPYATGDALGVGGKAAVVVATLVIAGLSTRYVEDPFRFSPRLLGGGRRTRTVYAWSATGMAMVVAVSMAGTIVAGNRIAYAAQASAEIVSLLDERPTPRPTTAPRPVGTHGASGTEAPSSSPGEGRATPEPTLAPPPDLAACLGAGSAVYGAACEGVIPPYTLVPDPVAARDDTHPRGECFSAQEESDLHVCSLGPVDAAVHLVAVGDSHSNQLLIAYEWIADAYGWRIDVAGHQGCHWTTVEQEKPSRDLVRVCEAWKREFNTWLDAQQGIDAMLVTMGRTRAPAIGRSGETSMDAAVRGLLEAWTPRMREGIRVIAVRDNPAMAEDVVSCVIRNAASAPARCSRDARAALGSRDALKEAVAAASDARLVDLTDVYCPGDRCEAVIGGVVVYADRDHVTATWARTLAPLLGERISAALP